MIDIQSPDWLRNAMEKAGVGTGDLSSASGVSRSQIQRILNGMEPRLGTLRSLAAALDAMNAAHPTNRKSEAA